MTYQLNVHLFMHMCVSVCFWFYVKILWTYTSTNASTFFFCWKENVTCRGVHVELGAHGTSALLSAYDNKTTALDILWCVNVCTIRIFEPCKTCQKKHA